MRQYHDCLAGLWVVILPAPIQIAWTGTHVPSPMPDSLPVL